MDGSADDLEGIAGEQGLIAAKAALRRSSRLRRDGMRPQDRDAASAAICGQLHRMIEPSATVMLYLTIRSEVDLGPFAAAHPGTVLAPRVEGGLLVAVAAGAGNELVVSSFGVPEPVGQPVDPATIDVVCVPGLAFDRSGGRLGYGAGFYDRFLPTLRPDVRTIGIGFSVQVVDAVPLAGHDRMLDLVLTEEGVVGGTATGNGG